MTIPQVTVGDNLAVALEGQLVSHDHISFLTVHAATDIIFGRALDWDNGTVDSLVKIPATAGVLAGIPIHTHEFDSADVPTLDAGIPSGRNFNILRRGLIYVVAETAIAADDPVYYRHTSPGADPEFMGRFRNDADTADAIIVTNARWHRNTAGTGELNILEIFLTT